jgi:hypothetical protein
VMGAAVILVGLAPSYELVLLVLPFAGAATLTFQTMGQSLLLDLSDFDYHGRLQGMVMLAFGGFGLATLPFGVLADAIGLDTTFLFMGVGVLIVMTAFTARWRVFRRATITREMG